MSNVNDGTFLQITKGQRPSTFFTARSNVDVWQSTECIAKLFSSFVLLMALSYFLVTLFLGSKLSPGEKINTLLKIDNPSVRE